MKAEDVKWCPQHGYPLPCYKCGMPLSKLQQKEIYQAGIREVVEWLRHSGIHGHRYEGPTVYEVFEIEEEKMENQLKEWGIEWTQI